MTDKSVNDQWLHFESIMKRGMETYIPNRTVNLNKLKSRKPLWMNGKALAKVRKKAEAYKQYRHKRRKGLRGVLYCKKSSKTSDTTGDESIREGSGKGCQEQPQDFPQVRE